MRSTVLLTAQQGHRESSCTGQVEETLSDWLQVVDCNMRCAEFSSRQMTDNIFEVETALAHVARAPQESGIVSTDFAAAYPSVNHSCIFHVLDKAELPRFICRVLQSIYVNSTADVEFAGKTRGQFFVARGVRQGCPAGGFLFAMAFDPIFRWLRDTIIPRNSAAPDFLQPSPCACADDFAVAASSFRPSKTALSPAFVVGGWAQPQSSKVLLGAVWQR